MKKRGAALLSALLLAAGCRDEKPAPDAPPPPDSARAGEVAVALRVPPDSVAWNQADTVVVTVTNGTAQPLADARLHLFVQSPMEVVIASSGTGGSAPELMSSGEGTRLVFALGALAPGATHEVRQAVRTPPAPLPPVPGAKASPEQRDPPPTRYLVRAWLTAPGETPAGRQVEDTLHIRAGSERVVGGCATAADAAVQRYGIGPLRIGMPAAALRSACPEARDTTWQQEGTRERGLFVLVGGRPAVALVAGDTVRRILVDSTGRGLRTPAGLGIGSTLGELRTAYGRGCADEGDGPVAVWFTNTPGVSFALDSATSAAWAPPAGPDALPDAAKVTGMWIHGQDVRCPARAGGGTER